MSPVKERTLKRYMNSAKEVTALCGSNGSVAGPVVNFFAVRSGFLEGGTFHMEQLQTLRDQLGSPFVNEGEDVTPSSTITEPHFRKRLTQPTYRETHLKRKALLLLN